MGTERRTIKLPERIRAKIDFGVPGGCWRWRARCLRGYGQVWWEGRSALAHRVVYEILAGIIPDGLELDHLCRNPGCVNPAHLEPVTGQENVRRSNAPAVARALVQARNATTSTGSVYGDFHAAKTHCPQGHAYAGDNLYRSPSGRRECRTCARSRGAAHRARKRRARGY